MAPHEEKGRKFCSQNPDDSRCKKWKPSDTTQVTSTSAFPAPTISDVNNDPEPTEVPSTLSPSTTPVITSGNQPAATAITSTVTQSPSKDSSETGKMVAAIVPPVVLMLLLAAGIFFCYRRHQRRKGNAAALGYRKNADSRSLIHPNNTPTQMQFTGMQTAGSQSTLTPYAETAQGFQRQQQSIRGSGISTPAQAAFTPSYYSGLDTSDRSMSAPHTASPNISNAIPPDEPPPPYQPRNMEASEPGYRNGTGTGQHRLSIGPTEDFGQTWATYYPRQDSDVVSMLSEPLTAHPHSSQRFVVDRMSMVSDLSDREDSRPTHVYHPV